jgi:hypothetical protein
MDGAHEDQRMTCRATITTTGLAVVFVGMTSLIHPVLKLIWNASARCRTGSMRPGCW